MTAFVCAHAGLAALLAPLGLAALLILSAYNLEAWRCDWRSWRVIESRRKWRSGAHK